MDPLMPLLQKNTHASLFPQQMNLNDIFGKIQSIYTHCFNSKLIRKVFFRLHNKVTTDDNENVATDDIVQIRIKEVAASQLVVELD